MKLTTVLRSGTVVTPAGAVVADVGLEGDRIAVIGSPDSVPRGGREFDVGGKFVLPGLIDPHVHLGLGDEISDEKMAEDFARATRDCLIGGVTTIATTTSEGREPLHDRFDRALACSAGGSWVDHKFTSVIGAAGDVLDIPYVADRGCVGFKFFTGYAGAQAEEFGMGPEGITPELFFQACRAIKQAPGERYAAIHAEEPYVREVLVKEAAANGLDRPLETWMSTSPAWAETVQVVLYGFVAHSAGVPLYVVHISSELTLDTVDWLRDKGLDITGETLVLFLSTSAEEMDQKGMGAKAKIQPPLRSGSDRERLWQALRSGSLTLIGTDSLTYSAAFKGGQSFWDARVGVNTQFADTLPLLWHAAVNEGRLPLEVLVRALSENAAKRLAIFPKKGAIMPGADADLVVVDPGLEGELGVSRYRGGADYSLWEGRKVRGLPVMTLLRGELVMCDGEIVAEGPTGRYIGNA